MEKELMKWLAWVKRGKQKRAVIRIMNKPMIPIEIYKEARKINPKISLNSTSDILRLFEKNSLAKCLNPKERVGRLYELTKLGKNIKELF